MCSGVTSGQLDVIAAQPKTVSCNSPPSLGQYDSYCEGLQVDYFLLAKQKKAPSLTGLTPNVSSFVPNLNGTVSIHQATSSSCQMVQLSIDQHVELQCFNLLSLSCLAWSVQAASANFKGISAAAAAKTYSFAVRYTGVLFIDAIGTYTFQLNSPAGTRLTVNGNTVTFNAGSDSRYFLVLKLTASSHAAILSDSVVSISTDRSDCVVAALQQPGTSSRRLGTSPLN